MRKNTILVIGAGGFIGSHLVKKHINNGYKVVCIDKSNERLENFRLENNNPNMLLIKCDLANLTHNNKSVRDIIRDICIYHGVDFAYNLLAVANPDFYVRYPIQTYETDFELNLEIIKALKHRDVAVPFMHFSTCEVYGKNGSDRLMNEDVSDCIIGPPHKLRWIYATSKLLLEQIILTYNRDLDMQSIIIRPFNIIGPDIDWLPTDKPDMHKPRVFSMFMDALIYNKNMYLVNGGHQKRCYCYIDDFIDAVFSVYLKRDICYDEVINIGNPNNEVSIKELSHIMSYIYEAIFGRKYSGKIIKVSSEAFYGNGYDDSDRRMPDITKIQKLTGWKPDTVILDTIEKSMKGVLDGRNQ